MTEEISLRYSGKSFGNSIDLVELGNSLLGFGGYLQLIAKENNVEDLKINVKATGKGSFMIFLELLCTASTSGLFGDSINIFSNILSIAKDVIELKKHLKGEKIKSTNPSKDGNISIENCNGEKITASSKVYNFYNSNVNIIDQTLGGFTSPLNNIEGLDRISIGGGESEDTLEINKDESGFFGKSSYEKSVDNGSIIEGIIKSLSKKTYSGLMECHKKNIKISFKNIKNNDKYVMDLAKSLAQDSKICIKGDIFYEGDSIISIDIIEVIQQNIL